MSLNLVSDLDKWVVVMISFTEVILFVYLFFVVVVFLFVLRYVSGE